MTKSRQELNASLQDVEDPHAVEKLSHDGKLWRVTEVSPAQRSAAGQRLVPALENAIAIIEYLNSGRGHKASLAELASELSISKSHCHALLKTLQNYDWLRFDEASKTYELHVGLLSSVSRLLSVPAIDTIRREITKFVASLGFPCVLSQPLSDGSFMLIDKFSDPRQMEVSLPIGHRYPRDACAQMRAYLGWASTEAIDEWMKTWKPVRYTKHTPVSATAVRKAIAEVKQMGYACSRGEFTDGLMAIALPIFDRDGQVQYILNCSAPIEKLQEIEKEVAARMRQAVAMIHRDLLARPPAGF